jgi:hypothetical protein
VRWIWVGTVAAAALAAAVLILIAHGEGSDGVAPAAGTSIDAALDNTAVDFGDPVTATVTVSAPRDAQLQVEQDLSPLTQLGRTRVTRVTRGDTQTVTYAARASCIDDRCLASTATKRIALRPAIVRVGGETTKQAWPILSVQRRVSPADAAQARPPLRSDTAPPPVSYRVSPDRLATLLSILAVVLAAAGVLLAGATATRLYGRRHGLEPLTGLERALALARDAERRPASDRRRALGLLARVLGPRDLQLADEAEHLAWSAPAPTPVALADLIAEVEEKAR